MATFYQNLHEQLITELQYDRADLDRELAAWKLKNREGNDSLNQFYRECLELGESHYLGDNFEDMERNRKLEKVYFLMFDLYLEAEWSRTSITRKLNYLRMGQALNHRFKVDVEIIPPDRCKYAEQFQERQFDIEKAMKEFPVDYSKCEREGGCVCTVAFVPIRDQNGKLIRKGN
jgi:hypothetical protein